MAPRLFACFGRGGSSHKPKNLAESATADQVTEEQRRGGAILVELFSSQGCTTSPQAELLMSRLGRGDFKLDVPVIVLAFHVDYWDYMGWKDPYGTSLWTVRQKNYVEALRLDNLFTPQVVVQGRAQCVGTDEDDLLQKITSAERFSAPSFQATFERNSPDTLQVSLTGSLKTKIDAQGADIMVALYENGLITDCPTGANKDRVLSNDFVVRKFEKMCTVKDVPAKKAISGTINFTLWEGFNSNKCGVAVFVQNSSLHIFGSQNFPLPDKL